MSSLICFVITEQRQLVVNMRIANICVKDLYKFVNSSTLIHMVFYNQKLFPDYIGKFSELCRYRLYDYIYDGKVDRLFFSIDGSEHLNIYVSIGEE